MKTSAVFAWLRSHWPIWALLAVPLAIFAGTLWQRGYILQYDMVFVPHPHINWWAYRSGQGLYSSLPVTAILAGLGHILPMDLVQKIFLVLIFYGAAVALYLSAPVRSQPARFLAGIAYSANPFTYDRLLAGHWLFLAGYALLPLVAQGLFQALTTNKRSACARAILFWTAAALCSPHFLMIGAVLFVALSVALIRTKLSLKSALCIGAGVALANSWWLLPVLTSHNFTQTFSARELYAFASQPSSQYGLWFNLLSFQGFWYEGWRKWGDYIAFWPFVSIAWLLPAWAGATVMFKSSDALRRYTVGLALAGAIGLAYAAGPASFIGPGNVWVFSHVPGMTGLREPQKLLSLYVLAVGLFCAFGLELLFNARRWLAGVGLTLTLSVVCLLAWPLLFAAHGQMHTVSYSDSWSWLAERLRVDGPHANVVVLPWDIYINKNFTGHLTANPAEAYYGQRAIASQRAGLANVADYVDPRYLPLQQSIDRHDPRGFNLAASKLQARYVVLVHSEEDASFAWLQKSPVMSRVHQDSQITIFMLTSR